MKIMMETLAAGPLGVFDRGKEYDLPPAVCQQFDKFWGKKPPKASTEKPRTDQSTGGKK